MLKAKLQHIHLLPLVVVEAHNPRSRLPPVTVTENDFAFTRCGAHNIQNSVSVILNRLVWISQ